VQCTGSVVALAQKGLPMASAPTYVPYPRKLTAPMLRTLHDEVNQLASAPVGTYAYESAPVKGPRKRKAKKR
jgi:hypothetical protein